MRNLLALLLVLTIAAPVSAQSLMDRLKEGAGKVGNATRKGADAVGQAARKGADAVEKTVESTSELVTDEETPEATKAKLDRMADEVLVRLLAENSQAARAYKISAGHAAFDMRRVSVFPLSAGYGRGVAVAPDGTRTYMQMGTGGLGAAFGIGGFESQFVVMFETPIDFQRFVSQGYDASVEAGAMQGEERTAMEVQFTNGRSFFVLSSKGWRVNANASGTRYWKDADLN